MTMTSTQASNLITGHRWNSNPTFFRLWMPYLFQKVEVPGMKHTFLPLNRDYKPLGMPRERSFNYPEMMTTHGVRFARDPATLGGVWWNQRDDQHWLYDDSVASRINYFSRLEMLMVLQMEMLSK